MLAGLGDWVQDPSYTVYQLKYREDGSIEEPNPIRLYHATNKKNLDSIREKGLLPGGDNSVWFSDTPERAYQHVSKRVGPENTVILEVEIPTDQYKLFKSIIPGFFVIENTTVPPNLIVRDFAYTDSSAVVSSFSGSGTSSIQVLEEVFKVGSYIVFRRKGSYGGVLSYPDGRLLYITENQQEAERFFSLVDDHGPRMVVSMLSRSGVNIKTRKETFDMNRYVARKAWFTKAWKIARKREIKTPPKRGDYILIREEAHGLPLIRCARITSSDSDRIGFMYMDDETKRHISWQDLRKLSKEDKAYRVSSSDVDAVFHAHSLIAGLSIRETDPNVLRRTAQMLSGIYNSRDLENVLYEFVKGAARIPKGQKRASKEELNQKIGKLMDRIAELQRKGAHVCSQFVAEKIPMLIKAVEEAHGQRMNIFSSSQVKAIMGDLIKEAAKRMASVKKEANLSPQDLTAVSKILPEYMEMLYPSVKKVLDESGFHVKIVDKTYDYAVMGSSILIFGEMAINVQFDRENIIGKFSRLEMKVKEAVVGKFETEVKSKLLNDISSKFPDLKVDDAFVSAFLNLERGGQIVIRISVVAGNSVKSASLRKLAPEDARPPKDWWDNCIARAKKFATDPQSFCGGLWYHPEWFVGEEAMRESFGEPPKKGSL
jgi:hypothetical protein